MPPAGLVVPGRPRPLIISCVLMLFQDAEIHASMVRCLKSRRTLTETDAMKGYDDMGDRLKPSKDERLDTRLESEGAEFLVLGQLLIHRIPSYKTYTNMPGYDLVATAPERNRSARIQVKSRWSTGARSFLIQNFDCDFIVVVLLNRGSKDGRKQVTEPQYYVFPIQAVKRLPRTPRWSKVNLRDIEDLDRYNGAWHLIANFVYESNEQRIGVAKGDIEVPDDIDRDNETIARLFYGEDDESVP